ncbi:MAG: class I SAM-dependent methyltransferase [Clostridiales bacterium]|nr:class I SAM-dependent methyltransferase [Clostridiales bacterium]
MITITIHNTVMHFETAPNLFSPKGLDIGTRVMLEHVSFEPQDKVLDLGCGYGVVGIYAAKQIGQDKVTMVDVDPSAVSLASHNANLNHLPCLRILQSDGLRALDDTGYTLILSNPPYNSNFSTAKHFIEKGFNRLQIGGRMYMVTKRKKWYQNKLTAIFGGVTIYEEAGYYLFIAEKRKPTYANKS